MTVQRQKTITGFSKLSKRKKIQWIVENFFRDPEKVMKELISYWHRDAGEQRILDEISENTISNYPLPYGVVPNFCIDDKMYAIPMVTEESSVVAAAASAAKYWLSRGGVKTQVLGTIKLGHVHFLWPGRIEELQAILPALEPYLRNEVSDLTANMEKRGGGIRTLRFKDWTEKIPHCYQLEVSFETCDSMGANFINSVLEQFARGISQFFGAQEAWDTQRRMPEILMSILSNNSPGCLVRAEMRCPISDLADAKIQDPKHFARRFWHAVRIAEVDPFRATTHNKGIFNGIDAVLLATANDFRAVEAAGHSYAARTGQYSSLSHCSLDNDEFVFWLEIPIAIGTVGGLTAIHPLAKKSFELLGSPNAPELMKIIASVGLAQNFSALRSLVTVGIQKGHMKMHLGNILNSLQATDNEKMAAIVHFEDRTVAYQNVENFLRELRKSNPNMA